MKSVSNYLAGLNTTGTRIRVKPLFKFLDKQLLAAVKKQDGTWVAGSKFVETIGGGNVLLHYNNDMLTSDDFKQRLYDNADLALATGESNIRNIKYSSDADIKISLLGGGTATVTQARRAISLVQEPIPDSLSESFVGDGSPVAMRIRKENDLKSEGWIFVNARRSKSYVRGLEKLRRGLEVLSLLDRELIERISSQIQSFTAHKFVQAFKGENLDKGIELDLAHDVLIGEPPYNDLHPLKIVNLSNGNTISGRVPVIGI